MSSQEKPEWFADIGDALESGDCHIVLENPVSGVSPYSVFYRETMVSPTKAWSKGHTTFEDAIRSAREVKMELFPIYESFVEDSYGVIRRRIITLMPSESTLFRDQETYDREVSKYRERIVDLGTIGELEAKPAMSNRTWLKNLKERIWNWLAEFKS